MRNRWLAPAGLAAAALVVAACGSSTSSGGSGGSGGGNPPAAAPSSSSPAAATSAGTTLGTTKIGGATVLTNAKGFTLYWFAPDTSTASKCSGSCATYWPPVPGPATAGSGVTGKLGVITRSDGTKQATWNGHPLYTYAGDSAPGQDKGNKINGSGGLWYQINL
jgi:predicted lipoprotein with Yx(FWY)xxD motif